MCFSDMEKNELDFQALFEVSLNQGIKKSEQIELPPILRLYVEKLSCLAAAVIVDREFQHSYPMNAYSHHSWKDSWDQLLSTLSGRESSEIIISNDYFYNFPLFENAWLVLVRRKPFQRSVFFEIQKIVDQLGKFICFKKEENRLNLLQFLFDNSNDAVQIAKENGDLFYINDVASKRLGISKKECHKFNVKQIESLFKTPGVWEAHFQEVKKKGKMNVEGINFNVQTQHSFPVEVTVGVVDIKGESFLLANSRDISERKSHENKLLEYNQKLESILNEMTDVVYSIKVPELEVLFVTPSIENIFEIKQKAWERDFSRWKDVLHPEDQWVKSAIYSGLENEGKFNISHRIVTPSGKVKWIRNKGKFILNNEGAPARLDGVVIERTAEMIAQESLQQEVLLQEALVKIASTYINLEPENLDSTINESLEQMGKFVEADRAYIFVYDFENETTSNTYEWCADGIEPEIENLQDLPIAYFPQWVEKHKNGETFYVEDVSKLNAPEEEGLRAILEPQGIKSLIAIPMLNGSELLGFVGFDSVEQVHAYSTKEQKLLELFGQMLVNIRNRQIWENQIIIQEEKFRNILANINLGLVEINLNDKIEYANDSFLYMSGFSLDELKGQDINKLFPYQNIKPITGAKESETDQSISEAYEVDITNKYGEVKTWFVSGAPNYNDRGQLTGRIGVYLDITAQKVLEKELAKAKSFAEAAAKAKELFLANMSHEIRTPLNVIIGMVRQLSKEDLSSDQQFFVKQSETSAKHLLTILNNILDIAKIESGELQISNADFSPSSLAYNVQSIMHSQAKEKNLILSLNVNPEVKPALIGDETRLRQVLINLVGNAVKFTNKGSIHLGLDVVNQTDTTQVIRFEVRDTGIGMSKEFLEKLFDKFTQEENMANRTYSGTGLGMAISRDLLKLMNSDLEVESYKDKGTTFSFTISFKIGNPDNLQNKSRKVKPNTYKGKKILLVEDNDMNRFIAIQSLDYLGFDVVEAENGKIALDYLSKDASFDLILMDIQMPVMDGVEATTNIRDRLKINTPIIALTANAFKHDIDLYLATGMNDFVTKPYDEDEFYRKIDHVLSLSNQDALIKSLNEKSNETDLPQTLYDLSNLEKLSKGNQVFINKMIAIFINLSQESSQKIRDGFKSGNYDVMKAAAHKIKPSIDQMGITTLKDVVREIEKFDVSPENLHVLNDKVEYLHRVLTKVNNQLEKRIGEEA
jgi:PAS domain S-box-containing protein